MKKLIVLMVCLMTVGCTRKIEIFLDGELVEIEQRKVGGTVEVLGKVVGSGFFNYQGLHKNVGVKFEIEGYKFTETVRIEKATLQDYEEETIIPIRVEIRSNGEYEVYVGNDAGIAKSRTMAKSVAQDIIEKKMPKK